jgi:integrase
MQLPEAECRSVFCARSRGGHSASAVRCVGAVEDRAPQELEKLMAAAKLGRHGHRDATMVLVTYRHGLRVSELVDLRWEQVDFRTASLHVRRVKQGTPSTHPILGDELRALRRLHREQEPKSPYANRAPGIRVGLDRASPCRRVPLPGRYPHLSGKGTRARRPRKAGDNCTTYHLVQCR